jgi:phosphatidyl-myo-inositol dimannoside synthase
MPPKIFLVSERFPPVWGGSRMYYYEVYRRFPPGEVRILTKRVDGGDAFDAKETLDITRRFESWENADYKTLTKYPGYVGYLALELLRSGADLVHAGDAWPAGVFALAAKRLWGVPYVQYSHGEDQTQVARSKYRTHVLQAIFDEADAIVANSRFTFDLLLGRGVPESKIRLITPGVDYARFSKPCVTDDLREKYGLGGKRVVLTVARFEPRKGFDTTLRALKALGDKHPDVVYLMVGRGIDKPRIEALVDELGMRERVRFAEGISAEDLVRHYALGDVFILANRGHEDEFGQLDVEGFGMVFLEANCQGKPVVGGRSGGTVDAVEHGVTGFLCDPDSVESFQHALDTLLSDPTLAQRMGEAGRARAERDFSWDTRSALIRQLSADVVARAPASAAYRALRRVGSFVR